MRIKIKLFCLLIGIMVINFSLMEDQLAQHLNKATSNFPALNKIDLQEELIGGVFYKSDLQVGFLNNGRFCAPPGVLTSLPSARFNNFDYLLKLDLWIGIPDGPWAPKVWQPDLQQYVSLGPTVSGSVYEPIDYDRWTRVFVVAATETDWSTINASKDLFYTDEVLYSDVYPKSPYFDFILAPTNEYEKTWPRNGFTGLREWPGSWKKNPLTGEFEENQFLGDQVCFITFDDKTCADSNYPSEEFIDEFGWKYGQERGYAIGAEVIAEVIGYQSAGASNIIIFNLKIINSSEWNYSGVYLGLYYESRNRVAGGYSQSFLSTKYIKNKYSQEFKEIIPFNLSYNYNGAGLGDATSNFFGVQLLKTPLAANDNIDNDGDGEIDEKEGEELGLTGWHYFSPNNFSYYFQREKLMYQILAGDPSGLGWMLDRTCFFKDSAGNLDTNFDDPARIESLKIRTIYDLLSCGPLNWQSGDTLNLVFGIMAELDYEKFMSSAQIARKIVENDYRAAEGPPPPKVTAVPQNGKITLYWDSSAETAKDFITGYVDFEGYKIYRTTSDPVHNDWGERIVDHDNKLINFFPVARCDLNNGINGYEKVYPFQKLGDDFGLFHSWTDTTVTNGVTYWYSVCAYDRGIVTDVKLNPRQFPVSPMTESPRGVDPEVAPNLVKVIPGVPASNYALPTIKVERLSESSGNGPIKVRIVDPFAITGHNYLMSFEDTTYGYAVYDLVDETTGELIFKAEKNTAGEEGKIFDGLQISVDRFDDLEVLNDSTYWFKYETGEPSKCTWAVQGGKLNWDPFPFEYEIRFTGKLDTSYYMKKTAPFEIWNTVVNKKSKWDIYYNAKTDTTDSLKNTWTSGDLIYIWDFFYGSREFTLRVTIREQSYFTYQGMVNIPPEVGDGLRIFLKRPFITGDLFRISTTALIKEIQKLSEAKKVRVVPNPYTVHAGWELSSNESKIQFINLPSECTIHIFSMVGDQVQTLYHIDRNTDYEFWDFLNFSNLKVSYGLYTFVVETPDGEKQKGKFVILR